MTEKIPWPKTEDELVREIRKLFEIPKEAARRIDQQEAEVRALSGQPPSIDSMVGYEAAADALWKAAALAMYYASSVVGATGFQASWAAMQFLKEVNGIKGPFMLVRVEDMLFPQYDVPRKVEDFLSSEDTIQWLHEQAKEKLADLRSRLKEGDDESQMVAPTVYHHWRMLAGEE